MHIAKTSRNATSAAATAQIASQVGGGGAAGPGSALVAGVTFLALALRRRRR